MSTAVKVLVIQFQLFFQCHFIAVFLFGVFLNSVIFLIKTLDYYGSY